MIEKTNVWEPPQWGLARNGVRLAVVMIAPPKKCGDEWVLTPIPDRPYQIGEPVWVAFVTRNGGDAPFAYPGETPRTFLFDEEIGQGSACYIPHLRGPDGTPSITSYGRTLQGDAGSYCECELPPGEELRREVRLDVIYDMTRIGEYEFSFSRPIHETGSPTDRVTSNTVSLVVVSNIWT